MKPMKSVTNTGIVGIKAMGTTPMIKRMCEENTQWLRLMPEPDNPYDANAVAVWVDLIPGAYKIGYLPNPAECSTCGKPYVGRTPESCECGSNNFERNGLATQYCVARESGSQFYVRVESFLGMTEEAPTAGLRIRIIKKDKPSD